MGSCPQGLPEQFPAPRPLHLPKPCTLCSPTFPKLPLSRVPKLLPRLRGAACEYQTAGKMLKSSARYGGCWMATPKPASLCERSNRAPPLKMLLEGVFVQQTGKATPSQMHLPAVCRKDSGRSRHFKAYHYHYAQAWNLRKRLLAIAMDVAQLENPEENRVATEPGTKKPRKFE